jgi:hypothetical protein
MRPSAPRPLFPLQDDALSDLNNDGEYIQGLIRHLQAAKG